MAANRPRVSLRDRGVWIAIAVVLVGGGAAWFAIQSLREARRQEAAETVVTPPRQVQVVALGRVEPASRVINVVPSESGRLERLLVDEGDQVEAGQILAYLELYAVRRAERDYAASQLAEAEALRAAQARYGEATIQEARTRVGQIAAPQAAAIEAQQKTIDSLRAELGIAEGDLRRFEQLYANGAISEQERDRQQATVDRLQEEVRSAEARKLELMAARSGNLDNAQAQVGTATANLDLSQAQVQVESAAQNLALAEARLAQTIIRAPRAGQILQRYVEPGEAVSAEAPVLALGDTSQMQVVAEVYETDVGLVRVGQSVAITSRNGAFDETLTGTVDQIGLQIFKNDVLDDDPAANADARVVEVRIRVDQSAAIAGLTNLQVDVAIDVESGQ